MSSEGTHKLMRDLSATENHTSQLEHDVKTVDEDLKTIDKDLLISKKINTSLNDLNTALGEAEELLEVVSIIPEIGAEASEIKKMISTFKAPVSEALTSSNKLEGIVGPIRKKFEQIEPQVKKIDEALLNTMNAENKFIAVLGDATHCINSLPKGKVKQDLVDKLNTASVKIDPIVLDFDKVQTTLLTAISDAENKLKSILSLSGSLTAISTQIDAAFSVLRPLISSLKAVKNALSHVIRVPYGGYPKICYKHVLGVPIPYPCGWHTVYFSFSVEQIIKGGLSVLGPVMDLLNDAMNAFLKPLLNALHLNIHLPSIPGLDNLSKLANDLAAPFNSVENALNDLIKDLNKFDTIITEIERFEKQISSINQACTAQISA
jgi:uncharacterized protein Yka (UPF0111/DUF47 family)